MNVLSSTERPTRVNPGDYSKELLYSGSGLSPTDSYTVANLAITDGGVRRQFYFEPGSSYTFVINYSFSASLNSGYCHGGSTLVVIWTNNNGVPTIIANTSIAASFNGLNVTTVFDPRVNKHRLNLSGFTWANQPTTWTAVANVISIVRT